MRRIRVIPVLTIKGSGLVKTRKFKDPYYLGDPINAVKIFNDKEVDEIAILDIEASAKNTPPNFSLISEMASEAFMPLAYGGGIRNLDEVKQLFYSGVEKIILNTSSFTNPELITETARLFGSQSVVVSIDVKRNWLGKEYVYVKSGSQSTKMSPLEFARKVAELGAGEIVVNAIDRDGTYSGYDLALVKEISEAVHIPVIALSGASSVQNFYEAVRAGASAVAAGSLFSFAGQRQGVLINYPSQQELEKELFSKI